MNREIKFRGKSKKTRKWLYGYLGESKFSILDYVYIDKVIFDNVLSFNTDNSAYVVKDLSVEEETIGQFTGLCDKNGNEIYEGDFVLINDQIYEVVYNKGQFIIEVKGCGYIPLKNVVCQVRGNIHDNPELLDDKS